MIARLLAISLVTSAISPVMAQPMSGEITAACMQAMDESEQVCACMEEDVSADLSDDQLTFLLAILTEDESKLDELRGRFTNEDAQGVQGAMMTAAFACMG